MGAMASQITGVTIVYSTVCSSADKRKHQSSVLLAFVVTGEFPARRASSADKIYIWWRHHVKDCWDRKIALIAMKAAPYTNPVKQHRASLLADDNIACVK